MRRAKLQRTAADEWALYGTYVPAPTGEQWARGALDFKASIGDVVSVDSSARLLPLQAPGKAKLPHPIMRFGGLVVGPGGARSDARYVMLHAPSAVYLTVLTQNVVYAAASRVQPRRHRPALRPHRVAVHAMHAH